MPCEPWTAPWRLIRNARTGAARLGRKKRSSNGVSERPRYGRIGCLALPYLWLFELFAPVVEIVGIVTIILAACLGVLSREFSLQFLIFGYAFATVISIGSVSRAEVTYKRYHDWQDVIRVVSYGVFEQCP